jgi:hypothetical protein
LPEKGQLLVVLLQHFGHVGLVENSSIHAGESVGDLLVVSQQNGPGIGRLLRCCRELFVDLRVVGRHPLAELLDAGAGPLLLRQLSELRLQQTGAGGRLDEDAVGGQCRVLLRRRRRNPYRCAQEQTRNCRGDENPGVHIVSLFAVSWLSRDLFQD